MILVKMNTTSTAQVIYKRLEIEAGRKLTSADRKGKGSLWSQAMKTAFRLVSEAKKKGLDSNKAMAHAFRAAGLELSRAESNVERSAYDAKIAAQQVKIEAVRHLMVAVPKYDRFSIDSSVRSEERRRAHQAAVKHNNKVIGKALAKPLTEEELAEAKELGMNAADYRAAVKSPAANGMTIKQWVAFLGKTKEAEKEEYAQMQENFWTRQAAENKEKVKNMRERASQKFNGLRGKRVQ